MTTPPIEYRCACCGAVVPLSRAAILGQCPNRGVGDDGDHLLRRVIDPTRLAWPDRSLTNPFLRYRALLSPWQVATSRGVSDEAWIAVVESLDRAIAAIDGRGFVVTRCGPEDRLGEALGFHAGGLWVKDETRNVSGSHKGRHLAGVLLHLLACGRESGGALAPWAAAGAEQGGGLRGGGAGGEAPEAGGRPTLAIASCGNAALAAAVVARAADWPLRVFVPETAARPVIERVRALGAEVVACARRDGERGDPCYARFREAVRHGAVAFCCQGPDQALTIEGGEAIAWEMIDAGGGRVPDRVFVQVGGGALASAVARGFADAVAIGAAVRAPRLHAVQTAGAYPLVRAYARVAEWIIARLEPEARWSRVSALAGSSARLGPAALAETIARHASPALIDEALSFARAHRSRVMWPWETEPHSIARGILDDETYDWADVVEAMLKTGGWPVVVEEEELRLANDLARRLTGTDADETGTAGLAGLARVRRAGAVDDSERVAVLFTGIRRGPQSG